MRDYQQTDLQWVELAKCMRSAGLPVEAMIEYVLSLIHICYPRQVCGWLQLGMAAFQRFRRTARFFTPVSYTHLDVYKRQLYHWANRDW